ncbi:hypothetical protein M422DRAFT_263401 [Sphaerobolus stellatus SS14]|uniref:SWIM-type domain-containing protein n=1 Tax=Sphaerobolus stellatus (strain SS14) TaxID=990650 RepID=A0A0C9VB03_SPHS4|nr:hypothetical protein M422DRAFT_263401 [Sphaerobolus stellatus SS14]
MASGPLKLLIEHILAPKEYPNNPYRFTVHEDEWENWLDSECAVYTNWRFKQDIPFPKSDRVRMFEWKRLYECDHAGQPRDRRDPNLSPSKRRKTRQGIKAGCMARIVVYKSVGDEVITINYYWKHNGHDPATLQGMKESQNPDAVQRWLDARVREGFDRKAIRAMLCMCFGFLRQSKELSQLTEVIDALPCSIKVSGQDIYNATRRKQREDTFLDDNPDTSIRLWMEILTKKGRSATYKKTPGEEARNGFSIMLCSPWQKEACYTFIFRMRLLIIFYFFHQLPMKYGDTICLNSTHNTCKGPLREKMFLSSILGQDRITGKGVPLAWLITNLESHHPLTRFLKWLRNNCGCNPHSIMIDCSDTEALAISLAFPGVSVKILYCYWHLWEAWDVKIKSKVVVKGRCPEDRAEILQDVRKDVIALLKCKKVADFDTQWEKIREDWADQKAWLKYMMQEWISIRERWCQAWRQHAHYGIDTNNYIESWHSNFKRNYLGRIRRQRADFIIRILVEEVEPDYMRSHIRIGFRFNGYRLCKAEEEGKKLAKNLILSDAEARIIIDSFTKDQLSYDIKVDDGAITACSCPAYVQSALTCKHMFLAQRITTSNICAQKAILPPATLVTQASTVEDQQQYKQVLLDKFRAPIVLLNDD